jgi:hypothetical protein
LSRDEEVVDIGIVAQRDGGGVVLHGG